MDYQLIIFLSKKELMAVDITEDGDCEEVSIDGNATMRYNSVDDFADFKQYICDAYNVDEIEEMEAGATIVNCGADAEASIALQEELKGFKGIDSIDVKKLLPIIAQNKGLLQKGGKTVFNVMGNCFVVKCDDYGVARVSKNKVTDSAVELAGADFGFLYFYKGESSGVSEEEIAKYESEIKKIKCDSDTYIKCITKEYEEKYRKLESDFIKMKSDYVKYKKIVDSLEAKKAAENDKFLGATIGGIIKFGQYFNDNEKSKSDIEWLVLDVEDDKIFVISKYIIEVGKFASGSQSYQEYYDTSLTRSWLNNQFYKIAFDKEEANRIIPIQMSYRRFQETVKIQDKVFLLSRDEIYKYLGDRFNCTPTPYVKNRGVYHVNNYNVWWTRDCSYLRHYVMYSTYVDDDWNANSSAGIRPAMWLKK